MHVEEGGVITVPIREHSVDNLGLGTGECSRPSNAPNSRAQAGDQTEAR